MGRIGLAIVCLFAAACSTIDTVSPSEFRAYELSLATSGDRASVAWHGAKDGRDAIYLQELDKTGKPAGPPHRITDGHAFAYEADLQLLGDDDVLAWYEKDPVSGALTAWLARVNAEGALVWRRRLDAGGGFARNPVVRVHDCEIVVAWIETRTGEEPAVWLSRLSASGDAHQRPSRIAAASWDTWNLNAAIDNSGRFLLTYDAKLNTAVNELQLVIVDGSGAHHVELSEDDGFASVYPDIGVSGSGEVAITWFDTRDDNEEVYLAVIPQQALAAALPINGQRVSYTAASSIGAYLSWNKDRLAVVWSDAQPGQRELYGQLFDRTGARQSAVERITRTPAQSSIPSIQPWRDGFLLAWNEYVAIGSGVHRDIVSSRASVSVFK